MKKKLLIVILVLLMLITSFFVLTKKPKIKYKKLKELNYNVTYKQAFPDENLRRGVVLCIMRDKCDGSRDISYYINNTRDGYNADSLFSETPTITEDDLKIKEEEQLSKVDLDKIQDLLSLSAKENVTTLQGIEYLINLKRIYLKGVTQENIDLSDFNNLTYLVMSKGEIKNINLPANVFEYLYLPYNKITDITFPSNIKINDLSLINNLLTNITIPEGSKNVYLNNNKITSINISTTVKTLYLNDNLLTNITIPEGVENVYLSNNKLTNLVIPSSVKTLYARNNNIFNDIIVPNGVEELFLSSNKITNIILSESLKKIDLYGNKISNINLTESLKEVFLSKNNITNINLQNSLNIETLTLNENPLKKIDITKLSKLKSLSLLDTELEDSIDFKNNENLLLFEISGVSASGKLNIETLNMPNKEKLYKLTIKNRNLENINLEEFVNLQTLELMGNKIKSNKIDLSKLPKLGFITLYGNGLTNIKIPSYYEEDFYSKHIIGEEHISLKVKKNSYVTIPKLYFNDKEIYLTDKFRGFIMGPSYDKSNVKRDGETYVFTETGSFRYDVSGTYHSVVNNWHFFSWFYFVTIEAGEEDKFNPVFNQGNYTPLINEEIPVDNLKEMITNLPTNIKNFEVLSQNTFTDKGEKVVKVRITFSDDTFKEVDIPVKVYEKEDILPTVTVTPETLEVIDKKPVNIKITRSYAKEDNIDNTNFIKTVRDNLVSYEYLNKANGLTYNSNSVTGVIDYLFTGSEEEHTFNITYKEKGNIYTFNKNISIKLLRDTDKDGIADKDDDDKDGDGFSNAVEIARGSDPYNKDSLPDMSKKDELDNLVKQLEKLIEDTKVNPFDTKNKLDVDNLKNNYLPLKVTEKDNIKGSYSATTSDTDLLKLIEKTKKEIDDIKKEINKLRDKANFEELDKEINKEVDNSYKELIDKIKEAKDLDRNTTTQEEVDKITKEIKDLREKIVTDKEELKKKIEELEKAISDKLCKSEACKTLLNEAKELYDKDFILKEEMFNMIKRIDDLLDKEKRITNPNTGIKTYSLVILFIIFISYKVFKKKKSYIR